MSNDLRITQIKLKLIEGKALTLQEQQIICEVAPMLLLAQWLKGKASGWINDQTSQAAKGQVVDKAALAQVDQEMKTTLGAEDEQIGSTITAFIMSLVQGGNPLQTAIEMGKAAAREYAMAATGATAAAQGAVTQGVTSALAPAKPPAAAPGAQQQNQNQMSAEELTKLAATIEPLADKWEAEVAKVKPPAGQTPPKLG